MTIARDAIGNPDNPIRCGCWYPAATPPPEQHATHVVQISNQGAVFIAFFASQGTAISAAHRMRRFRSSWRPLTVEDYCPRNLP